LLKVAISSHILGSKGIIEVTTLNDNISTKHNYNLIEITSSLSYRLCQMTYSATDFEVFDNL